MLIVGAGVLVGVFGHFSLAYLFVIPFSGRRLDIDCNTVSKNKQPVNQKYIDYVEN